MKTLDKVIEELQYWDTCDEYPECFYDDEVNRDALHYLKEYQKILPLVPSLINTAIEVKAKGNPAKNRHLKTLDEVIAYFDNQTQQRHVYLTEDAEDIYNDALHYLKTIETTENLYHDAVNELSKWKDEDWKDRCLPLTWDELKTMIGKPIWVEYEGYAPDW